MSATEARASGEVPHDPFKLPSTDFISNSSQMWPLDNLPSNNSVTYFPSQERTDPVSSPGIAPSFDLNAAGGEDDDEDGDGQMIYQEGHESQETEEVDRRSVFVGNVDYGTTPPELQEHFKNCGAINRITIMVDRYTGHPKGYAYIEFQDESAIPNAVSLSDSTFRDRQLKVLSKRKNVPGFTISSRGRGAFGRGSHPGRNFRGGIRGRGRGLRGVPGYFPRYRGRGHRGVAPY